MRVRERWRKTSISGEPHSLDGARGSASPLGRISRWKATGWVVRVVASLGLAVVAPLGTAAGRGMGQHSHSAPAPAPHPSSGHPSQSNGSNHGNAHPAAQHLPDWIQKNQGLSPQEQQRRLQQERGYNQLPPDQQRRLQDTLNRVNQMPPDQRQRYLERNENMERLPPQRQQQIRNSASRLAQMAPDRQQATKEAIRTLRNVPPGLRQRELNSPQYSHLSPDERGVAGDLLSVEPYHPPPPPPR